MDHSMLLWVFATPVRQLFEDDLRDVPADLFGWAHYLSDKAHPDTVRRWALQMPGIPDTVAGKEHRMRFCMCMLYELVRATYGETATQYLGAIRTDQVLHFVEGVHHTCRPAPNDPILSSFAYWARMTADALRDIDDSENMADSRDHLQWYLYMKVMDVLHEFYMPNRRLGEALDANYVAIMERLITLGCPGAEATHEAAQRFIVERAAGYPQATVRLLHS